MAQSSGMGDIIWLGIIGVAAYFGWQWWQSQSVATPAPAQPAPGSNMPAQPAAPPPAPLTPPQTSCPAGYMLNSISQCQPIIPTAPLVPVSPGPMYPGGGNAPAPVPLSGVPNFVPTWYPGFGPMGN